MSKIIVKIKSLRETTSPPITRRQFLKNSSVAAAALGVASHSPLVAAPAIERAAHPAGSDLIKVGMVGCGGRNSGAAVQVLTADPGARLVAMGDIFLDRIQSKRDAIKKAKGDQVTVDDDHCFTGFGSYQHVIESCDVVLIANAAKFHPLHALTAIQAGKHVFVEKPHGIDPAGLKTMAKACALAKEKGLSLLSGLQSRYHPGYVETIQRIHDGAIGEIISLEENFLRAPYGIYERKPGLTELEYQCSTQYHFRWLSGDDVPQSLVHNLDRASWVLGNKPPLKCHGLGGRSSMIEPTFGDVFDHHSVVYAFENEIPVYAFCRTTTGCYDENSSIVRGTKGKASVTHCRIWGETNWRWHEQCDPYQLEQDHFLKSIRSCQPLNSGDYMVRSTAIGIMGQLSCYTGKEVSWEQLNASDLYFPPRPEDCKDGMEPPTKPDTSGSYPVLIPGRTVLL